MFVFVVAPPPSVGLRERALVFSLPGTDAVAVNHSLPSPIAPGFREAGVLMTGATD